MQRKEEEVMNFLQRREAEINDAWRKCEEEMRAILWREFEARERIFQDRDAVLQQREIAVADGEKRLATAKELFEERAKNMGKNSTVPKVSARRSTHSHPTAQFSPMKSVVLTATGEALATPSPVYLAVMFDLRKSEDEADDKDRDLGEKTKSKSQRSGTGDFTENHRLVGAETGLLRTHAQEVDSLAEHTINSTCSKSTFHIGLRLRLDISPALDSIRIICTMYAAEKYENIHMDCIDV
ncbi:hypothetical protein B0H13DRAFT_1871827 [Mycena leptocephala]|nr:hypothetical protein B0H13DRAFT_1871827 [Mycena leptocephala]